MKDQYAADINDYLKYALLRTLSTVHAGTLHVCWMRTASDGRSDGSRLAYLANPVEFRSLDPLVFDELTRIVACGARSVRAVEKSAILPRARFHGALLNDLDATRRRYFDRVWSALGDDDLVFFDPDNGLEVPSVPRGRRNCCKYLFWDEINHALGETRSVCVYQHFPRVFRPAYLERRLAEFSERFPAHRSFAVYSSSVAYLVCARPGVAGGLKRAAYLLSARIGAVLAVASPTPVGVNAGAARTVADSRNLRSPTRSQRARRDVV
jgi:hypothetical protein